MSLPDVATRVFGQGPRDAFMLHCSLAHSGAWRGVAELLGDRLTMTAMDLPGHGKAAPWDGVAEIQGLAVEMALSVLPAGPVDLIGHSFGATVALRLAVEHPERVRSLSLIEPVFFGVALADDPSCAARQEADWAEFAEYWRAGDREGAARAFTQVWGGGSSWEALPEKVTAQMAAQIHLIPAADSALFDDVGGILEKIDRVKVPVGLIEGGNSPWVIAEIAKGLVARLADARRVVVPGAGHMVPMSDPRAVAAAIASVLDRSA